MYSSFASKQAPILCSGPSALRKTQFTEAPRLDALPSEATGSAVTASDATGSAATSSNATGLEAMGSERRARGRWPPAHSSSPSPAGRRLGFFREGDGT
jgi:hypothetical protein